MSLASGTGWGDPAACIAFTKIPAGTLSLYKNIVFKIKTTDYTSIMVKVPTGTEKIYALSTGTALAGGWVQMTVPLSDFGDFPASSSEFAVFNKYEESCRHVPYHRCWPFGNRYYREQGRPYFRAYRREYASYRACCRDRRRQCLSGSA